MVNQWLLNDGSSNGATHFYPFLVKCWVGTRYPQLRKILECRKPLRLGGSKAVISGNAHIFLTVFVLTSVGNVEQVCWKKFRKTPSLNGGFSSTKHMANFQRMFQNYIKLPEISTTDSSGTPHLLISRVRRSEHRSDPSLTSSLWMNWVLPYRLSKFLDCAVILNIIVIYSHTVYHVTHSLCACTFKLMYLFKVRFIYSYIYMHM